MKQDEKYLIKPLIDDLQKLEEKIQSVLSSFSQTEDESIPVSKNQMNLFDNP